MAGAFSPNGNNINEKIFPVGSGLKKVIEFKIYNRWGQLVFENYDFYPAYNNESPGWDGTFNGKDQNADTYVYYIKAETVIGTIIEKKGAFSLIR